VGNLGGCITELYRYSYDKAQRLLSTTHALNGGSEVTLVSNAYDELGRLKTKNLGRVDTTTYAYNVRSWVKNITGNRFAESLYYNQNTANLSNFTACYNGNIAGMQWNIPAENLSYNRAYTFAYDGLNRLKEGKYTGGTAGAYNETFGYDKMGNITNFARYGLQSTTGGIVYGLIDDLTITHNGNQLVKVTDTGNDGLYYGNEEFLKNTTNTGNSAAYDANGNRLYDSDANVWAIKYNALNLPDAMQFYQGHQTNYTYSAAGAKLRVVDKTAPEGVTLPVSSLNTILSNPSVASTTTTDYDGSYIYENGSMKRILLPEGYYQGGYYFYYLKDHLGSNRVVVKNDGTVVESSSYYPSGMRFGESIAAANNNVQPYRHTGHEMQEMHGLNWIDNLARFRTVSTGGGFTGVDPLCEKYYSVSPYAYVGNDPINTIDPLGMDSCRYDPNVDAYQSVTNGTINEVTCTASATYKNTLVYWMFGELAFGNSRYTSEHLNRFIWTNKETTRYVNAEMQVAQALSMGVGGVGAVAKIASIGWKSLKTLDIGIMAGKALGDAIGQFGGKMIQGQSAAEALKKINILSVGLSGLGVDPLSASALSSGINISLSEMNVAMDSNNYIWNTALGTVLGVAGNGVGNLNRYKSLTIGVQMRTALSTSPSVGESAANAMIAAPGVASTLFSTAGSK
jgi:RHS repeat-associated protein